MTLTRLYALQYIRLLDQTLSNIQSFSIMKTDSFVSPSSENSWTDYPDYPAKKRRKCNVKLWSHLVDQNLPIILHHNDNFYRIVCNANK